MLPAASPGSLPPQAGIWLPGSPGSRTALLPGLCTPSEPECGVGAVVISPGALWACSEEFFLSPFLSLPLKQLLKLERTSCREQQQQ